MTGEHPMLDLRSIPGFSQRGGIIVFTGEFGGKTTTMAQIAWKARENDKDIQISEVPLDRIKFHVLEDSDKKPTVSFDLRINELTGWDSKKGKYAPLDSNNLNDYVAHAGLVTFSLSQRDFESFRGASQNQ